MTDKKIAKVTEGYKGFNKDFTCNGFQFEENKTFEEKEAVLCESGFHFCTNPFDILNYYNIHNSEFCKVKALSKVISDEDNDSKHVTSKIEIGVKLGLNGFVNELVRYLICICESKFSNDDNCKDYAKIGSSDDYTQIGSSGDYTQIGSCGESAKIGSCGESAKIGSSGNYTQIGSSGYSAKIGSCGYSAHIGSSEDSAQIGSSGNSAKIGSSGYYTQISSSGNYTQIGSSGYSAKICSSGYSVKIGSSGYSAKIGSSGDSAQITVDGYDSVCSAIGFNSKIKSKIGNWITLAEWGYVEEKKRYVPLSVKSGFVDGKILKADVFYELKNGEFVEV